MTLVSIASALLGHTMVERFHARSAHQGDRAAAAGAHAAAFPSHPRRARSKPPASPTPIAVDAVRRFRSPATRFPHAAFLSNGNYVSIVTNSGRRRELVPRPLRHARPARRDARPAAASSSTCGMCEPGPSGRRRRSRSIVEPRDYLVTLAPERATFHRVEDGIATNLEIAVSPEDDVEVRRLAIMNRSDRVSRDRDHELRGDRAVQRRPRTSRTRRSASCSSKPNSAPTGRRCFCRRRPGGFDRRRDCGPSTCSSLEGRLARGARMRDGPQPLPGPRPRPGQSPGPRRTISLEHHRRDARSHRQPAAAGSARAGRVRAAVVRHRHGVESRNRHRAGPRVPRTERVPARTFALAVHARTQHCCVIWVFRATQRCSTERLASRVLYLDGSLRASPGAAGRRTRSGKQALWAHSISGDLSNLADPRGRRRCACRLIREVLEAQEYWRLKGLGADIVILNEHPASYLDEMHEQIATLADRRTVARRGRIGPAASISLRADHTGRHAIARCSLRLRAQFCTATGARSPTSSIGPTLVAQVGTCRKPRAPRALVRSPRPRKQCHRVEPPPLFLFNGLGGFTADGREYVVVLDGGSRDAGCPGVNVIANPIVRDDRVGLRLVVHVGGKQPRRTA